MQQYQVLSRMIIDAGPDWIKLDTGQILYLDEAEIEASQPLTLHNRKRLFNAIDTGETVEISLTVYDHFLDLLPPVYMQGSRFGFREGDVDPIIHFWKSGRSYFCKQDKQ